MKYLLEDMLTYCRPEGSATQKLFCEKYLEPVFGRPDRHGNYIHIIGDKPNVLFLSHHDTVHRTDGFQKVRVDGDIAKLHPSSNMSTCLGADCTTGVYIMLSMIEEGVEGVYVVHAGEEIGCLGSHALVNDHPAWLDDIFFAISFDRYGTESIITHQMGMRTASDEFANLLSEVLNMPMLKPDKNGSYTDSNEYSEVVAECTNISVGYYKQHSTNETQDLWYVEVLISKLISADWARLEAFREPGDSGWDYESWEREYYGDISQPVKRGGEKFSREKFFQELVEKYPKEIAAMLDDWGLDPESVMHECQIEDYILQQEYYDNQLEYYIG